MIGSSMQTNTGIRELESLLIRQLLNSSGVFRGESSVAGSSLGHGMFVDALADAMVEAGGLGIADSIGDSGPSKGRSVSESRHLQDYFNILSPVERAGYKQNDLSRIEADDLKNRLIECENARVSSSYGYRRDPFTGQRRFHAGMDIAAAQGTPVRAIGDGVVRWVGDRGNLGLLVEIEHEGGVLSRYAHTSRSLVSEGEVISRGQQIAEVGETGRATGPHLHFELRREGIAIDPLNMLKIYSECDDNIIKEGSSR